MTQEIDPKLFDARLFALYGEHAGVGRQIASLYKYKIHPMAGDKLRGDGWGRPQVWGMSDVEAMEIVHYLAEEGDARSAQLGGSPSQFVEAERQLAEAYAELWDQISALEHVYQQDPWTRWFPCLNADGHIHSTLRGCPTVDRGRHATEMGWATELSGMSVEAAIEALGPRLCSVCFPDAPAEHCLSLRDITRADREAAKTARAEAKFIKNLRPAEIDQGGRPFRDGRGDRVETVAHCEKTLRDEVEARDRWGSGPDRNYPAYVKAAETATRILLARGYEQARIDKIIANAVRKNRKDGARI